MQSDFNKKKGKGYGHTQLAEEREYQRPGFRSFVLRLVRHMLIFSNSFNDSSSRFNKANSTSTTATVLL